MNAMRFVTRLDLGILGKPDSESLWQVVTAQISDELLLKPDVKILVIAAGHGTEAKIIFKRMLSLGVPREKVQESIWVLDKYQWFVNSIQKSSGIKHAIAQDFLSWQTDMKFDIVIGNPPYGKNANLAVKFVNKAAELSDLIWMVLPRTFRKEATLNRVRLDLHLITDRTNPSDSFGGGIQTCTQQWVLRNERREKLHRYSTHPDFTFVDKASANVFIGRVGGGTCGLLKTEGFEHYSNSHYFLKIDSEEVIERLRSLAPKFIEASAETVGMASLSKHDLIRIYKEHFLTQEEIESTVK